MGKTIKTVSVAAVALAVLYLVYQLIDRKVDPCEGIFQQSAVTLKTKLDVIKAKGEFAIGRQKVQDLTERSQQVALNLKACCIVLGKSSADFLRCKEGFDKYDAEINKVATSVQEAVAAKEQGKPEIATKKIAEANESAKAADTTGQAYTEQVARIKEKSPAESRKEEKPPAESRKEKASESAADCCRTVANPDLKGLGRIVVTFPEGSKAGDSYIAIFRNDDKEKRIADARGRIASDLVPGQYDVEISGGRVGGVAVRAGHDTRIRAGILRLQAGSDTYVRVFRRGGSDRLVDFRGSKDVGLPIGEFDIEVAGQRAPVTIKDAMITEF